MTRIAWKRVADRRIYFGHQSVGQDVVDGMRTLCAESGVPIRWIESDDPVIFDRPGFAHSRIGRNREPMSKIDAFADKIRNGIGNSAEIAFFKLCYVDVTATTEVEPLFGYYAEVMARLKSEYPQTLFAHTTVPLTVVPHGWRRWALRLRGRGDASVADNVARTRFNRAMRSAYAEHEPLFDLAAWEADGGPGRSPARHDAHHAALDRRLSSDGGHLSLRGQAVLGAALLDFLCAL